MKDKVKIWNYGDYSSGNYGSCMAVMFGPIELYFSYKTIVAFRNPRDGLVICKNVWSHTTGRHLNCINPNHSRRLSYEEFDKKLEKMMKGIDVMYKEEE